MAGPMMLIAMQDLMQVLLVVACVFAGWSLQTSACSFLFFKATRPLAKTVEYATTYTKSDDSDESEADAASGCKEVFVNDEALPHGLKLLEQYGAFGAAPGAWTSRVAHKATV